MEDAANFVKMGFQFPNHAILNGCLMRLANLCVFCLLFLAPALRAQDGVLPVGKDGKPLNLDFETGTLKDWTAEGDAFVNQPIKGDTVSPRRADMKSQHQGNYWIGTYEVRGDKPQGTLTSVPFAVTHPWGSFLFAGGAHPTTVVELVRKDSGAVFFRTAGIETENLERHAVDLQPHQDKEIFIRLVDKHSGGWGHVNFDDFRFHSEKPKTTPRGKGLVLQPDAVAFSGLPPEKAAQVMTVPPGFDVKVFAGEPDVHQPIAMCLDDRGRVWVAEGFCYPIRRPEKDANDRIMIYEDVDGDGKFDKKTMFMEKLNLVSGLEVGFGGVWIGAAPHFLFVPMNPGEDKPSGPAQILLDGFGYQDTHETLNTFTWGPDGWLYGCHGVFTHSRVGKPGTPDKDRIPMNAAVWRYHPTRHVFEIFAHGTSNPWGLDFNDRGQAFVEACVIPHGFHIIQGGRYQRQAGQHFNPYTYEDIKTIVDHFHYLGATPHSGNNKSDAAGGGHAHCGLMFYLGGSWPKEYRDQLFMGNLHGHRLNMDIPKTKGSGYVLSHGPDFLSANDAWARFINFRYGPDGNVYLLDWYDKQACHVGANVGAWDRTNGRIYKICYRGTKWEPVDLAKKTDAELVELQLHPNDWYVRHARRILQERGRNEATRRALRKIAHEHADETRRLRGLWALHATGGLEPGDVVAGLNSAMPYVRAWTIQLSCEKGEVTDMSAKLLIDLAAREASPIVRLYLASALQRMPVERRAPILKELIRHAEDAGDHNLPLMYWYAAEPLAAKNPLEAYQLVADSPIPKLAQFMVRRIAATGTPEALDVVVGLLSGKERDRMILAELKETLKGRREVPMPKSWPAAFDVLMKNTDAKLREQALSLAVTFGDARALARLRDFLSAASTDADIRKNALDALVTARDAKLPPLLHGLLDNASLRGPALKGLASFDDPKTPAAILAVYPKMTLDEKRDALNTLASRPAYGKALFDAVAAKTLPASDISADLVRQLRNLNDKDLDRQLTEVWGITRATPADKAKLIAQHKKALSSAYEADLPLGRAVYARVCAQCHILYGVGGKIGPDITGSNRANLDYLLENIIDPSAVIPKEYAAHIVNLNSGRVVTGILKNETPTTVQVQTANELLTIAKSDIDARLPSALSMMPDDLVAKLPPSEFRALVAYLRNPTQTPLLATKDNVKEFYNGKDLTGWDGDPKLWSVENGEIVGRSPGLKENQFLRSHMLAGDFRLTLKVKLAPNAENSGIQFRSEALPGGDVKGPQADVGAGWWGKLYEEHGRGLLWDKSGEAHVKLGEWNTYEIVAQGATVRTSINGQPCVNLTDAKLSRRGIFAFQLHSGGAMEVRYKEIQLEILAP
jgi:putative membrane-bound dehydrogenase-like protein